jgi:hypothetical protein
MEEQMNEEREIDVSGEEAHHADMLAFEKQAEDALKASLLRPLTADEVAALAWAAHIPNPIHTRS